MDTPKKYFTLSIDDGVTQDLKIIEILKKYNMYGCTFNINTGLCGANWKWVGDHIGRPDVTHLRFTEEELRGGIYNGFDVVVHTLTHPSLSMFDNDPNSIRKEICEDAENILSITGKKPIGMAWPGGDTEYTEKTIRLVLEHTDIRYARATTPTNNFNFPDYFMKWMPTCSFSDNNCLDLAEQFISAECNDNMLFYVWGHGYELDIYHSYDKFEKLVKLMTNSKDIIYVTNTEFYHLFKDVIPSWKD